MSFQFKWNKIIYIYLQISTRIYTVCRCDSLVVSSPFSYIAAIKKKSVGLVFERSNKYNNFIKHLTKALALISLQITNHIENSEITAAKQWSTAESHFPLTNNKHKAILHQPFWKH